MGEPAEVYQFPGEIGDRRIYVVHNGPEPIDHPAIQISHFAARFGALGFVFTEVSRQQVEV